MPTTISLEGRVGQHNILVVASWFWVALHGDGEDQVVRRAQVIATIIVAACVEERVGPRRPRIHGEDGGRAKMQRDVSNQRAWVESLCRCWSSLDLKLESKGVAAIAECRVYQGRFSTRYPGIADVQSGDVQGRLSRSIVEAGRRTAGEMRRVQCRSPDGRSLAVSEGGCIEGPKLYSSREFAV